MNVPYAEIAAALLLMTAITVPESGDVVGGVLVASSKSGGSFTGEWTSYTHTQFGTTGVEFFEGGKCGFRTSANTTLPCKWDETANGRTTMRVTELGITEAYSATVSGDTMIIREPGRETRYVRVNSRDAYERRRLVNGPG